MIDPILTGTNPKGDAKLLQDIQDSQVRPDEFEGGCPADVTPHTSIQAKLIEKDREDKERRETQDKDYNKALDSLVNAARERGIRASINWLLDNGYGRAARELSDAAARNSILK